MPHSYAGKSVQVRQPLDAGTVRMFHQRGLIAEHRMAKGKGGLVVDPTHYARLPRAG